MSERPILIATRGSALALISFLSGAPRRAEGRAPVEEALSPGQKVAGQLA